MKLQGEARCRIWIERTRHFKIYCACWKLKMMICMCLTNSVCITAGHVAHITLVQHTYTPWAFLHPDRHMFVMCWSQKKKKTWSWMSNMSAREVGKIVGQRGDTFIVYPLWEVVVSDCAVAPYCNVENYSFLHIFPWCQINEIRTTKAKTKTERWEALFVSLSSVPVIKIVFCSTKQAHTE